ncbi:COG4280 domain-containing protein [Nocardioides sp.]|uniref:COG4280 domain-containing protein n=1 Tax=Nocardioides sp. TaxID=35761 RepID=UPI002ED0D8A7
MLTSAEWALAITVFIAAVVELVETLTIVLAIGLTRGWRSTLAGVVAALLALTVFTAVAGYSLATWLPEAALQLVVGSLMLVFGLQWLRKAVLRSSGLKSLHDEEEEFRATTAAARDAGVDSRLGLDWFAFVVSFKGVFLEGVEIVFIVITFGLSANSMGVAVTSALVAAVVVLALGAAVHKPLTKVPENTLKYVVGLLLATFGTYWSLEGLGIFSASTEPLEWPGEDLALPLLLLAWLAVSRAMVWRWSRLRTAGPVDVSSHLEV